MPLSLMMKNKLLCDALWHGNGYVGDADDDAVSERGSLKLKT